MVACSGSQWLVADDRRNERIAELERENAELKRENAELHERIARLEAQLRKLTGMADPEGDRQRRKLKAGKPRGAAPEREGTGRKPGGQPGHPKHERPQVPPEQVAERHDCVPDRCEKCSTRLRGRDPHPLPHQVFHLPQILPWVVEYLLHALRCWRCGHVTHGRLPSGVPKGAFAPSVTAAVALLMGAYRMSKRDVQSLMLTFFQLPMSLGAVVGCQKTASNALAKPFDEAAQYACKQRTKYVDETSWRQGRRWVWLWTLATASVVIFKIQMRRNTAAARSLLGRIRGFIVTDRAGAYNWWTLWLRQVCWSHLTRDFAKIAERGGESAEIGHELVALRDLMFHWWHRVRDGTMKRETFQRKLAGSDGLKARMHALLERGQKCWHPKTARTCAKMLQVFPAFWTFAEHRGIEPTNNEAERRLRPGVMYRRVSLGTKSEHGSRFVERMLTVVATLRRQKRDVLAFLREACEAQLTGSQFPSLLPTPSTGNQTRKLRPAA